MRAMLRHLFVVCVLGAAAAARADDVVLTVSFAANSLKLTAAELAALPHVETSTVDGHEKKSHTYSGVPVRDLLAKVGVPFGEKLRGKALRMVVVARTRDNYAVVYAVAEFDEAFSDRTVLLVDRQDGQPLGAGAGPVRIVAPGDKRPARWARMVVSLDVVSLAEGP